MTTRTIKVMSFELSPLPLPVETWASPMGDGAYVVVRARPWDPDPARRWYAALFPGNDEPSVADAFGSERDEAINALKKALADQMRTMLELGRPEIEA